MRPRPPAGTARIASRTGFVTGLPRRGFSVGGQGAGSRRRSARLSVSTYKHPSCSRRTQGSFDQGLQGVPLRASHDRSAAPPDADAVHSARQETRCRATRESIAGIDLSVYSSHRLRTGRVAGASPKSDSQEPVSTATRDAVLGAKLDGRAITG
jgi:hypothetical protein